MPVAYSGIIEAHLAVRTRAAMFDVSHMGEIEIAGRDALAAVQRMTSNDASKLRALYWFGHVDTVRASLFSIP